MTLPIDAVVPEIVRVVRQARAAVIVAAPGAGKTTRVPPALVEDGPVIVLQPRRVAARAIAGRIASERGWTLGEEIGWQVRFERRFSSRTRVLIATEGILTARLLADPLLSDFRTVVLDEFHERSMHADLGIALAKQAWLARDDLRLVVMSATIDARPVSAFLKACPIVEVPERQHPVAITYAPGQPLADAVREVMAHAAGGAGGEGDAGMRSSGAATGNVLCFLPGAPEIRRAMPSVQAAVSAFGADVVPLHGSLDAAEQDRAIQGARSAASGSTSLRVILATNIAETSLTVPDVHAVIDTGLHKVARYDPARGIDSLELERISLDSADQRAGRAGRLGPGIARRLWDSRDRLRPHREPDIARIDLAAPLLDLLAWGGDPATFDWFESPPASALDAAWELLERLSAVTPAVTPVGNAPTNARSLTPLGRALQRLPLHPRLARILISANGARDAARACASLAERHYLAPRHEATTCDLLAAIDAWQDVPPHIHRVARELEHLASADAADVADGRVSRDDSASREQALRRAIFDGYADRVGRRRAAGSPRVLLASGHGSVLAVECGVRDGEFLVALDVQSQGSSEALIRMASLVDRDWLRPTRTSRDHWFDRDAGRVRAARRDYYGEIVLAEHPIEPEPDTAARLLGEAYLARGLRDADQQLVRRLAFAGLDLDAAMLVERLVSNAAAGVPRTLDDIEFAAYLTHDERRDLDRFAPERLPVPSGRSAPLTYEDDGTVSAAVKLQELFGLADTPRLGRRQQAVLLHLLAPNGRPVQMTRDLRSFWERTYPEVRKELRGRYPKHPWPEDPWSAEPTARTLRRKPG